MTVGWKGARKVHGEAGELFTAGQLELGLEDRPRIVRPASVAPRGNVDLVQDGRPAASKRDRKATSMPRRSALEQHRRP